MITKHSYYLTSAQFKFQHTGITELSEFKKNVNHDKWVIHHEYDPSTKNKDLCMIYVEDDLSNMFTKIPFILKDFNIRDYLGVACWTAGWGSSVKAKGKKFGIFVGSSEYRGLQTASHFSGGHIRVHSF